MELKTYSLLRGMRLLIIRFWRQAFLPFIRKGRKYPVLFLIVALGEPLDGDNTLFFEGFEFRVACKKGAVVDHGQGCGK